MRNNRLKNLRLKKDLSQEYVAFKLGISQKSYSDIENGKTKLRFSVIIQLADILEITPHEICPISKECIACVTKENK